MVREDGNGSRNRKSVTKKPPKFFYLGGELHYRLQINRPADRVVCWNYPQHKRVSMSWSETKRLMKPALSTSQVAKILNRSYISVKLAIEYGYFRAPYRIYSLTGSGKEWQGARYYWSIDDVMEAHDHYSQQHVGAPRKDGLITPKAMPTKVQVRAMIEDGVTTYLKTDSGEYVPTYKETLW